MTAVSAGAADVISQLSIFLFVDFNIDSADKTFTHSNRLRDVRSAHLILVFDERFECDLVAVLFIAVRHLSAFVHVN